ncbi:putative nucleotidyltransferase substrate binding domain-containing protein [Deefgea rivuli]|uniref:putative nucleotidyltransferase substrate binding domain-containing protein n=1 Tax=Deefgea rivuli TaxID=400948 RepID=UPI00047F1745|nr:putative nucleotidyltransferase substrate binding domain-containing protein [Deefgea rivuli]
MSTLFNFSTAPYSSLSSTEQERFEQALDIQYFPSGSTVIAANSANTALLVLSKGLISEEEHGEVLTVYSELETLNSKALLSESAAQQWVAIDDSLVFSIPRELILELIRSNPRFGAYFYQDIAQRLATLAQQSPAEDELQALLLAQVKSAYLHPVKWLASDASVLDAARMMREQHCTAVLIQHQQGAGIFTQSDLRDFVITGFDASQCQVADYARYRLYSVSDDEPLHAAMVLMARHTIGRVVVTQNGEIIGILEQVDLLAFLTQHSHLIQSQIERASNLDELGLAWAQTEKLIRQQQRQGIKITLIAATMRELHRKFLAKIWLLIAPAEITQQVCVVCLGSEGRGEQILPTDQDNALIIADGFTHPDLVKICEQFNQALIRFGYPPCPGKVMLNNPYWRRSEAEFKLLFNEWTTHTSFENMMHLAIWLDAYPIIGDKALFARLRDYLLQDQSQNDSLLGHFARPIEQFDTPLGFFSQLRSKGGQLDLKKGGIFTLVHGIRSLTLKAGLKNRNSYHRIDALCQHEYLSAALARDLSESLAYLQSLQLKYGLQKSQQGKTIDNLIELSQLTTLERDLLKDTLVVVKRFKQSIAHQFKLHAL